MKYRTILLFGGPGAGKGTQGKILGTIPRFFHCACGDVFRGLRADAPLGRAFIEHSSRGELVPDQPTIDVWRQFIDNSTRNGRFHPERDTLVLDGIPRNLSQAEMLQDALNVVAVFYLRCTHFEKLVERIQRRALVENRLDDANLVTIKARFKTYERETKPVLEFYGKNILHRIDATKSPSHVLQDILKYINKLGER